MAMAASSSSPSMEPWAAMMARETPHTAVPTASREASFGSRPNLRASHSISASDPAISTTTSARLIPPSCSTSPRAKRAPSRTMPTFSQKSQVAMPAWNTLGSRTVLASTRPMRMAHSTYSTLGRRRWRALAKAARPCSVSLPSQPTPAMRASPGSRRVQANGWAGASRTPAAEAAAGLTRAPL